MSQFAPVLQETKSPARRPGFLFRNLKCRLKFLKEIAGRTGDIDSAGDAALAVLDALHDARGLAAFGAVRRLRCIHDLLAVASFCNLCHSLEFLLVDCLCSRRCCLRLQRRGAGSYIGKRDSLLQVYMKLEFMGFGLGFVAEFYRPCTACRQWRQHCPSYAHRLEPANVIRG